MAFRAKYSSFRLAKFMPIHKPICEYLGHFNLRIYKNGKPHGSTVDSWCSLRMHGNLRKHIYLNLRETNGNNIN